MKRGTFSVLLSVCLISGFSGAIVANYEIPWYVFAAGGGSSTNGVYEVTGTVGHANAAQSTASGYELGEGFWRNEELCFRPANAPQLILQKSGADLELSWNAVAGATVYDVVRGDLAQLRSSAGDFATATNGCVADDTPATVASEPTGAGQLFFLVRPAACFVGSYDSAGGSQTGTRDDEIGAAPLACP